MAPRAWRVALLSALIPPRCGICAAPAADCEPLCGLCSRELRRAATLGTHRPPGLDDAWSAFEHDGLPRSLIGAAKYRMRPGLVEIAARELAARLPIPAAGLPPLVPVPADPWRVRRRGFDLAGELAAQLAGLTDSRVITGLRRARSAPQAGKDRSARLAARLTVQPIAALPGQVVLIDDVVTTGTTLAACARAARSAGAERVMAITFTRSTGARQDPTGLARGRARRTRSNHGL